MTGLLEFEWERLVDGYRLERLDADLLTTFPSLDTDFYFIGKGDSSAPQWVRDQMSPDEFGKTVIKHRVETTPFGDRCLFPNGRETEWYRPLDMYPALFMELADSDATPEGVARFISQYGQLKNMEYRHILVPGELFPVLEDIKAIKSAVRSWERYRKTGKAKAFIKRMTDELLNEANLYVELREMPEHDTLSMVFVPITLIAAIWLQFAQAITANYGFRQCDECLTWFQVAPGKGRPEKRFCSNACSMRAYRKRKAERK